MELILKLKIGDMEIELTEKEAKELGEKLMELTNGNKEVVRIIEREYPIYHPWTTVYPYYSRVLTNDHWASSDGSIGIEIKNDYVYR